MKLITKGGDGLHVLRGLWCAINFATDPLEFGTRGSVSRHRLRCTDVVT